MQNEYNTDRIVGMAKIAVIAIVAVVVIFFVYNYVANRPAPVTTSTTSIATSFNVNSCMQISTPGTYYIQNNITTSATNGACLSITASNVRIIGNSHGIIGNGPFTLQGPDSYGILIGYAQTGIVISNLTIAKFSYGISLNNSNSDQLNNVTIINSTVSGIKLYDSSYNQMNGVKVKSSVSQPAVNITLGKYNNISRSSIEYNLYSGIALSNSTGNRISNTTMVGNPVDLACSGTSTYSISNKFMSSSCFENTNCNFAYCSDQNNQSRVSGISLESPISTCGSINQGGLYTLSGDLNLADYMNITLSQGRSAPCILINASNVYLSCNGHNIVNSHYGIYASKGLFNVTVADCNFNNDTYGIYLDNMLKFGLNTISAVGNTYGLYIMSSTDGNMTNIEADRNSYGTYINGTTYATLYNFHVTNNIYGISIDNSTDVYLSGGTTISNSGTDLYCSASTYNSTLLSVQDSTCGSSDCQWAQQVCPIKHLPTLSVYPVSRCTTISAPGEYALEGPLLDQQQGTCFRIMASYVVFTCKNNTIISVNGGGTAFNMSGVSNVTVEDCGTTGFTSGFVIKNTKGTILNSTSAAKAADGFNISNSSSAFLSNDVATGFSDYGFLLSGTNGSTLAGNHASSPVGNSSFMLSHAFHNTLRNNTANFTDYGYHITNSSSNWLYNNSATSSKAYGFYCDQYSGGILSQGGRVNYGVTKANCLWLVELPFASAQQVCRYMNTPDQILLTQDMLYSYGDKCFTIYSNSSSAASGTTINCEGHTIYATHGGSFITSYNSSATVENCILIGFTNPIEFISKTKVSGIAVINNTIVNTANTSIYIDQAQNSKILYNNITNSTNGIWIDRFNGSYVEHNLVDMAVNGIYINNSESTYILNNTVNGTVSGVKADNSQLISLENNNVTNSRT
jgi:parallel beta-helix repeat protein